MGCASSADVAATHHDAKVAPVSAASPSVHHCERHTPFSALATPGASASSDAENANPLLGDSATPFHPDAALDAADDAWLPVDTPRKQPRHRSLTVVCGVALGYETPEPPIEEQLARIERRAAIAPIHGITADVNQFRPDPVSAAELARCREVCREWLLSVS